MNYHWENKTVFLSSNPDKQIKIINPEDLTFDKPFWGEIDGKLIKKNGETLFLYLPTQKLEDVEAVHDKKLVYQSEHTGITGESVQDVFEQLGSGSETINTISKSEVSHYTHNGRRIEKDSPELSVCKTKVITNFEELEMIMAKVG